MPKMVLNRNYTLNTTLGHCVRFKKGVPTDVPKVIVQQALSVGAEAVDEAAQKEVDIEASKDDPKARSAVPTGDERKGKIKEVLEQIASRNQSGDFTAGGKPKLEAINAELDFKVTTEERDELWTEVIQEREESGA